MQTMSALFLFSILNAVRCRFLRNLSLWIHPLWKKLIGWMTESFSQRFVLFSAKECIQQWLHLFQIHPHFFTRDCIHASVYSLSVFYWVILCWCQIFISCLFIFASFFGRKQWFWDEFSPFSWSHSQVYSMEYTLRQTCLAKWSFTPCHCRMLLNKDLHNLCTFAKEYCYYIKYLRIIFCYFHFKLRTQRVRVLFSQSLFIYIFKYTNLHSSVQQKQSQTIFVRKSTFLVWKLMLF